MPYVFYVEYALSSISVLILNVSWENCGAVHTTPPVDITSHTQSFYDSLAYLNKLSLRASRWWRQNTKRTFYDIKLFIYCSLWHNYSWQSFKSERVIANWITATWSKSGFITNFNCRKVFNEHRIYIQLIFARGREITDSPSRFHSLYNFPNPCYERYIKRFINHVPDGRTLLLKSFVTGLIV